MKPRLVVIWWIVCLLWSSTFFFIKLMMGVAEVPVAIALGAVVFGERLPSGTLLGGACVLAAVVAGLRGTPR